MKGRAEADNRVSGVHCELVLKAAVWKRHGSYSIGFLALSVEIVRGRYVLDHVRRSAWIGG